MSELYEKMLEEEKADRVTRFVHPDIPGLIGFNYINIQARVLCFYKGKQVNRTFNKFFNVEEVGTDILFNKEIEYITSKEDGSLIIMFNLNGQWICHTRGSFKSPQVIAAQELIKDKLGRYMYPGATYLFEYVGPSNKNVCRAKYDKDELILLAVITYDGIELNWERLDGIAYSLQLKMPKYFMPSEELYNEIKNCSDPNVEGIVVKFKDGTRVKVKSELYIKLHRVLTGEFTSKRILDVWLEARQGNDLSTLLKEVPDEFFTELNEELKKVDIRYNNHCIDIYNQYNRMKLDRRSYDATRKELALEFPKHTFLLSLIFSEVPISYIQIDAVALQTFIRKELKG